MASIDKEDEMIRDNYISHIGSLKNNDPEKCPSPELLIGFQENKLSGKTRRIIEDHIVQCPLCLKALEGLSNVEEGKLPANWPAIEKMIGEKFYSELDAVPVVRGSAKSNAHRGYNRNSISELWQSISEIIFQPKRLVYAGTVAVLVILSIYSYAYLSRDRYFSLARIEPEQHLQMRALGPASTFTEGLGKFEQKEYDQAILNFNSYLNTNPDHYASLYYLGLCHLLKAEERLLGLPYKFDEEEIEKGMTNLSKALQLSKENLYYQADCYWYLGKAYLMKKDTEKARLQFISITKLDHNHILRKEEARDMINILR